MQEILRIVESGNTDKRRNRYQETRICQKSVVATTNIWAYYGKCTKKVKKMEINQMISID